MPLLYSVEMGIKILEDIDKSIVACKSVEIVRRYWEVREHSLLVREFPGLAMVANRWVTWGLARLDLKSQNGLMDLGFQIIPSKESIDWLTDWLLHYTRVQY